MHSDELIPAEVVERARAVRSTNRMNPLWKETSRIATSHALSDRELDVLRAVAEGMGNKEIAETLEIGMQTVMMHIKKILAKLSARNRAHAVSIAYIKGILEVEDE